MTKDELDDMEFFTKRRQQLEKHRKEYNNLIDRQDSGEGVDEDRLCLLELVDRKWLGESLTEDKFDAPLEEFEADEEEEPWEIISLLKMHLLGFISQATHFKTRKGYTAASD
jgi:hypothetical protein